MVKEYRVEFRCAASAGVWVEERARLRGTSRSDVWREIMRRGLASYDKAGVSGASPLTRADDAELRWWRQFAERTAVNGDPLKTVEPGIELPGWTFMIIPSRDEHLDTA